MAGANHLGRFIKECRTSHRYTSRRVEELTRSRPGLTAISHSNLLAIEKGSHVPSFDKILTLSHLFNVPTQHFEQQLNRDMLGAAPPPHDRTPEELTSAGRNALQEGEHARALELFTQALAAAETQVPSAAPSLAFIAEIRLLAATCRRRLGLLRLAQSDYEDILALEDIPDQIIVRTGFQLAEIHRELRNFRLALLHAQAALDLVGDSDPPLRAKIVNTLANILDDRGRSAEAIVCYRQALQLFDQAGDRRAAGLVARNLGTALHRLGDTGEAERLLERGVAIAREDNDRRGLAYGLANLARQRFLRGDLAAAKCVAAEAKETAHSENYLDALFMSLYYLWKISLGENQKALCRAYAERLRVLHRKLETRSDEADAWLREHEQASTRGVSK